LFLGKMQSVETAPSEESTERLARFVKLQPENALANYYYAVSLWKLSEQQSGEQPTAAVAAERDHRSDSERLNNIELLLLKAVHIDPNLAAAYLQLGILYAQREDFTRAISAYQNATNAGAAELHPQSTGPELDETVAEAHYRLARVYLRTGDKTKAQEQLQLHDQLMKKINEDTNRERREIQEFVISLQNKNPAAPSR
jgi:tetratricopeptide (TPR) repeat protein